MTKPHRSPMTANKLDPPCRSANPPAEDDAILDIRQTAKLTNKPVSTLYWLRGQGQGPRSGKLGRRVIYRRSDVLAWIESAFEGGAAS